jgi:hypothetical protein
MADPRDTLSLPVALVKRLLETSTTAVWVTERTGDVLLANERARQFLKAAQVESPSKPNLFKDVFKVEPSLIIEKVSAGEHELELELVYDAKPVRVRVQWVAEPGCFLAQVDPGQLPEVAADTATQLTVQELLQEREITYRNLLAAYLKL